IAAFALASLLTMADVTRRTREIGTLKALGWPTRRIVAQIMGQSIVTGTGGALLGVAVGFAGITLVNAIAPKLTASLPQHGAFTGTPTVAVHLVAHAGISTVLLAVLLAIGGALLAGSLAAWRATRLRPADAFAQLD